MSADIGVTEAVGKVIVPESIPSAATRTETDKVAIELKKTLDEKGADVALKSAAGRRVDQNVSSRAIDENIGSKRDEEGKMERGTGTPEETRHNDAKKIEATTIKYLDKGYDALSDTEKTQVRKSVYKMLQTYPAIRTQFDNLGSAADKKAYLEKIARDPNYSIFVAELMNEIVDPSKIKPETISELQIDVNTLTNELKSINDQLTGTDGLTGKVQELQDEIKQLHPKPGEKSNKSTNLSSLRAKLSTLDTDIEALTETRQEERDQLDQLQKLYRSAKRKGETDIFLDAARTKTIKIDALKLLVEDADKNYKETNKKYTKMMEDREKISSTVEYLDGREEKAKQELDKAQKDKVALEEKKRVTEAKLKAKKLELGKTKTDRTYDEEQFVKNLNGVFTEAAAKYFDAEINKAEAEMRIYLEKKATDLTTGADAALSKGLLERYYPNNAKRIDATQVVTDKDSIITTGPKEITKAALKKGGYSDEQIKKLQEDKVKWNELMGKTAETSLKYYWLRGGIFHRGGKLHMDEQMKIMDSPWGKEVITKSVEGARAQIETVLKEKLPEHSKLGEWFRKIDMKKWLIIIAIILGIVGIGGFAATRG